MKAGPRVGTSRKKNAINVVDSDSTGISDPDDTGSDPIEKGNGSGEESDGGMAQDSGVEFDQAKLTEKDAKRVLIDEVISFFFSFFLLT